MKGNISSLSADLLRILGPLKKPGLTSAEIAETLSAKYKKLNIQKAVSNAAIRGHVAIAEPDGFRTKRAYYLSKEGRERFNNLASLTIKDDWTGGRKKRRKTTKREPDPNQTIGSEAALPVNISTEANHFADYASALVAQNAEYRAVLLQVYNTIGKLLHPPKPTTNKEK